MEFCPECETRLVPKRGQTSRREYVTLTCPKCGYKKQVAGEGIAKVAKVIQYSPQKLVAVISKEEQKLRTLPTVRVECPKCGNNSAYVWQVQTRGADESSTQFLRCTKCEHTFREYS